MGGFEAVYEKIKAYSEMTKSECAFIYDLCQERKPKKIVEIGVSSGAGSLLLEKGREVGFLCEEAEKVVFEKKLNHCRLCGRYRGRN